MSHNMQLIPIERFGIETGLPLSVISFSDLSLNFKRCYWLEVDSGSKRGNHAHKKLKQLIFCVLGRIKLRIHDGETWMELELNSQTSGLLIEGIIWREIYSLESKSILFVLADELYEESDYIRSFSEFLQIRGSSGI